MRFVLLEMNKDRIFNYKKDMDKTYIAIAGLSGEPYHDDVWNAHKFETRKEAESFRDLHNENWAVCPVEIKVVVYPWK